MNFLVIWTQFIEHYEKNNNSPVLVPILKMTSLLDIKDNKALIGCENLGIKIFLNSRKDELERSFSAWTGEPAEFIFDIKKTTNGERKTKAEPPLLKLKIEKDRDSIIKRSGLQKKFTFDNFAVSGTNQIAYTVALSIADSPGTIYNPLFIYGTVGVGKTHLSQAVANKIIERDVNKKVLYSTSEEFTNDLIDSIRSKDTAGFRKKYRELDILVVDDIQFIAGKNYIQEEFYHTFNRIIHKGGQIIMTSDSHPKDIKKLEDRLRSRFSGGLTIDIQKPDFELRSAILLIKAKERNIDLDIETAKIIAENVDDVRELEGKLLEIYTRILRNNGAPLDLDTIKNDLFKREKEIQKKITNHDVIRVVCSYYNIKPSQIRSSSRKENITLPRQIIMYILRMTLELTLDDISLILKKKDHTTIMHGVDKITNLMIKNPTFKEEVDRITKSLTQ